MMLQRLIITSLIALKLPGGALLFLLPLGGREPFPSVSPGLLASQADRAPPQWSQRPCEGPQRSHHAGPAHLLHIKRLQEETLARGIQISPLHPATGSPNEKQAVPQFPHLYERGVMSPTHLSKDLLLFICALTEIPLCISGTFQSVQRC